MPTQGFQSGQLTRYEPMIELEAQCPCCDEPVRMDVPTLYLAGEFGHVDCGDVMDQVIRWTDAEVVPATEIPELEYQR